MVDFVSHDKIEEKKLYGSTFLRQTQSQVTLNEIVTEISCTTFEDRIMIIITQINKVGSFIYAACDKNPNGQKYYQIDTLLGRRDDPLLHLYARQLIERIALVCNKPLILGISLKDSGRDAETFQTVFNKVLEINTWM